MGLRLRARGGGEPGAADRRFRAFIHDVSGAAPRDVVVSLTHRTVESAVAALKRGAFDFITKPFEQTELLNVVRKAVLTHQQRQSEPVAVAQAEPAAAGAAGSAPQVSISSIISISENSRLAISRWISSTFMSRKSGNIGA